MKRIFILFLVLTFVFSLGFGAKQVFSQENLGEWESMNETLYAFDVPKVKILSGDLVLAYFNSSLERSTDGGITWDKVGEGIVEGEVVEIIGEGDYIFVFTKVGVYRSEDRGATWKNLWKISKDFISFAGKINEFFYIGTEKGNVFKSKDFSEVKKILTTPNMVLSLEEFDGVLFIGTLGGLFKYKDEKIIDLEKFKNRSVIGLSKRGDRLIIISNDNRVLLGDVYTSEGFIDISEDGEIFITVNKRFFVSYNGIINFNKGLFVFSDDTILFSEDGKKWREVSTNLPKLYSMSVDPEDSNHVLIGTESGVYESLNMGRNFYQITGSTNVVDINCALLLPDKIYLGTSGGVLISEDNGKSWKDFGLSDKSINILLKFDGKIYAGTNKGLFFFDGEWEDTGIYDNIYTISKGDDFLVVGSNSGVYIGDKGFEKVLESVGKVYSSFIYNGKILVGTSFNENGGLFISEDKGKSWKKFENTPQGDITSILVIDGKIIISIWYMGVFEYENGKWVERNEGLTDLNIKMLKKDPFKDLIFAATMKGIFYSDSSLKDWKPFGYTLRNVVINGIYINPFKENDYIVTTWLGVCRWKEYILVGIPQVLSIKLIWKKFPENVNVAGYEIYRVSKEDGEPKLIKKVGKDTHEYIDSDVEPGTTYAYFIKSFDDKSPPNYYVSNFVKVVPMKDEFPPEIEIIDPKVEDLGRIFINKKELTIKGMVKDNIGVEIVKINDEEIEIKEDGSFEYTISLEEGSNLVEIYAMDVSGNEELYSIYIEVDTIPPEIDVNLPDEVSKEKLKIEGKTEELGNLYVNGKNVLVYSDGTFSFEVDLKPGMNTLRFVAIDRAGNKTEKTFKVLYRVVLKLQIGNKIMYVNNKPVEIDVPPKVVEGRTLLPIRWVAEPLGAEVSWDGEERKVTVSLKDTTIELWIGKNIARVNGVEKPIDPKNPKVVPMIINGRTMLPVRFVAENLGCSVSWDKETRTVTITYPE